MTLLLPLAPIVGEAAPEFMVILPEKSVKNDISNEKTAKTLGIWALHF